MSTHRAKEALIAVPKRPPGRPRLPDCERAGERVTVRLTPEQADELRRRGGAPAIRAWLDATPEPSAGRRAPIATLDDC